MEATFEDLIQAVKASPRSPRVAIALAASAVLAILAGAGLLLKGAFHDEPQRPTIDIGQILHPGVV